MRWLVIIIDKGNGVVADLEPNMPIVYQVVDGSDHLLSVPWASEVDRSGERTVALEAIDRNDTE